jgi:hypothetical protein
VKVFEQENVEILRKNVRDFGIATSRKFIWMRWRAVEFKTAMAVSIYPKEAILWEKPLQ